MKKSHFKSFKRGIQNPKLFKLSRYGFNGKEKDDEHSQGKYDFGARIYDSRIGRWMSIDKHFSKTPFITPYHFSANNPIIYNDNDGNDHMLTITPNSDGSYSVTLHATFYTETKAETKRANNMANVLNDISRDFIASGNINGIDVTGVKLIFDFDIDVQRVEDAEEMAELDNQGNVFEIVKNKDERFKKSNGTYADGRTVMSDDGAFEKIIVAKSAPDNTSVHEAFHLFGASHAAKMTQDDVISDRKFGSQNVVTWLTLGAILSKSGICEGKGNSFKSRFIRTDSKRNKEGSINKESQLHHESDMDREVSIVGANQQGQINVKIKPAIVEAKDIQTNLKPK